MYMRLHENLEHGTVLVHLTLGINIIIAISLTGFEK
jgi:hypothetical protein